MTKKSAAKSTTEHAENAEHAMLSVRLPQALIDRLRQAYHRDLADGHAKPGISFREWYEGMLEQYLQKRHL